MQDQTNFVDLEGWYENDTHLYIAMEFLEAGNLARCLDGDPVHEQDAREITFQVNEALEFMHQNGFVHRDVKPNVGAFHVETRSNP
jgi:serine/threonine protein kinase